MGRVSPGFVRYGCRGNNPGSMRDRARVVTISLSRLGLCRRFSDHHHHLENQS